MPDPTPTTLTPTAPENDLLRLLRGLRYGQVVVQVHDGRVVQIERTERFRTDQRIDQRDLGRAS